MAHKPLPMKSYWYAIFALAGIFLIILLYYICKWAYAALLKYEASKDRSYNVFDKADLSWGEKRELHSWKFLINSTDEGGLTGSPRKG